MRLVEEVAPTFTKHICCFSRFAACHPAAHTPADSAAPSGWNSIQSRQKPCRGQGRGPKEAEEGLDGRGSLCWGVVFAAYMQCVICLLEKVCSVHVWAPRASVPLQGGSGVSCSHPALLWCAGLWGRSRVLWGSVESRPAQMMGGQGGLGT